MIYNVQFLILMFSFIVLSSFIRILSDSLKTGTNELIEKCAFFLVLQYIQQEKQFSYISLWFYL